MKSHTRTSASIPERTTPTTKTRKLIYHRDVDRSRLLVVDDDAEVGNLLTEALTQWGYQPTLASSGGQALGFLKRQVFEAARTGPYVMPRFSKAQLSDGELTAIARYVQYAKHPDDRGGWSLGHLGPVPEGLAAWFFGAFVLVAVCAVIGGRLRHA